MNIFNFTLKLFGSYYRHVDKIFENGIDKLSFLPYLMLGLFLFYIFNPIDNMSAIERLLLGIYRVAFYIFFRNAKITGTEKIPHNRPCLFVCAPHANQYLDGLVTYCLLPRQSNYIMAAITYTKRFIGTYIKKLKFIIPVRRAQDYAIPGVGKIKISGNTITGDESTNFTSIELTSSILVNKKTLKIKSIISNDKMTICESCDIEEFTDYKIIPKLDHHEMFHHVYQAFDENKAIVIFPEGGSHDRTQLMNFYPGCASIPLNYLANNPDKLLYIVPVGLNYYNGHRFRSRVNLVVGDPMTVPTDLLKRFKENNSDHRPMISELLEMITSNIRKCIFEMHGGETTYLNLFIARQLYTPINMDLSLEEKTQLTINFSKAYAMLGDDPQIVQFKREIENYIKLLQILGLRDDQIREGSGEFRFSVKLRKFILNILYIVLCILCSVPGLVLITIPGLTASIYSRYQAREALKNSNVKIRATDVMGTSKVVISLAVFPVCIILNTIIWDYLRYYYYHHPLLSYSQLVTFIFLQPFIMYGGVRCAEVGKKKLRSCMFGLLSLSSSTQQYLCSTRSNLHIKMVELVNEFGPQVFGSKENFTRQRIIDV